MPFKAFISYSHAADGALAPAIQRALQRFAKPWYRLRALRVYRDETNLSATPELWPAIEEALGSSEYFLLLASPEAARSKWVAKEVRWWIEHRSTDRLLIGLTGGELVWDDDAGDFDWNETTSLPDPLRGRFRHEPKFVDFRWADDPHQLTLSHPRFLERVLDIAAPLHGVDRDELGTEDVRQHRITKIVAGTAVALILAGALGASWMAVVANRERREAERNLANSVAQSLAREAPRNPGEVGVLMAAHAYRIHTAAGGRAFNEVDAALREVLNRPVSSNAYRVASRDTQPWREVRLGPDGRYLLGFGAEGAAIFRIAGTRVEPIPWGLDDPVIHGGPGAGGRFFVQTEEALGVFEVDGDRVARVGWRHLDGSEVEAATDASVTRIAWIDESARVRVWDVGSDAVRELPVPASSLPSRFDRRLVAVDTEGRLAYARADGERASVELFVWHPGAETPERAACSVYEWLDRISLSEAGGVLVLTTAAAESNARAVVWDFGQSRRALVRVTGVGERFASIAHSADRQRLALGTAASSIDGIPRPTAIRVIRLRTVGGAPMLGNLGPTEAQEEEARASSFSCEPLRYVGEDGEEEAATLSTGSSTVGALRFDGERLIARVGGNVWVWDRTDYWSGSAEPVRLDQVDGTAFAVGASVDGRIIGASRDGGVRSWRLPPEPPTRLFLADDRDFDESTRMAVAFLRADAQAIVAGGFGEVSLWKLDQPRSPTVLTEHQREYATSLAVDAGGSLLASGWDDGAVKVTSLGPTRDDRELGRHGAGVIGVGFLSEQRLVSADRNELRLWDLRPGPEAILGTDLPRIRDLTATPACSRFVTAHDDGFREWTVDGRVTHLRLETPPSDVALAPDCRAAAFTDGQNVGMLRLGAEPSVEALWSHPGARAVAVDPEGQFVASGGQDGQVLLWRIDDPSEAPIEVGGSDRPIIDIAYSPTGLSFVTASSPIGDGGDGILGGHLLVRRTPRGLYELASCRVWYDFEPAEWDALVRGVLPFEPAFAAIPGTLCRSY